MSPGPRTAVRALLLACIVLSTVAVGVSYASTTGITDPAETDGAAEPNETAAANATTTTSTDQRRIDVERRFDAARSGDAVGLNWSTERVDDALAASDRNLTVVATQGFYVSDERAEIAAFLPNGTLVYYDDRYRVYFDVDPVPGARYTVEYVAASHLSGEACSAVSSEECTRNVVERVNLTTGDHETVYAEVTPRIYSARWHDVDRLNDTYLVVADIVNDGVYAVDTRDGSIAWRWNASAHYDRDQGGESGDWTHVNDVELLADGSVMVSPRNMDEVIFLERGPDGWAVNESRTVGTDDDHSVLYEQHNPDYIPEARGGPAVLVADSENGRIVEFNRTEAGWEQEWVWRDVRLQWPRDADRLPDGSTLVVDSHGDRVAEIGPRDEVVWSADVGMPYDVERLGTGDESAGGPAANYRQATNERPGNASAVVANLTGNAVSGDQAGVSRSAVDRFWLGLKDLVPSLVANGLLYVAPAWVRFSDLVFASVVLTSTLGWSAAELYWSRYTVRGFGHWIGGGVSQAMTGLRNQ